MNNGDNLNSTISVIVPIYKVELYLRKCIDSILAQTYRNFEIILVDDGSPDDCPAICDEYAKVDSRIKVIHKVNGGLSDARNVGMDAASGDFLMFVDSDDWLEDSAVEALFEISLRHNAQIVIGGTRRVEDETLRVLREDTGDSSETVMSNTQAMAHFFENGCAAWGRLYRREIHDGIRFPVGQINEDEAVVLALLERCETVVRTDRVVYNYRCRPESITTSTFTEKKLAWYRHCADNLEWIKSHHPELELLAAKRLCGSVLWSLREIALSDKDFTAQRRELLTDIKVHYKYYCSLDLNRAERLRLWAVRWLPFSVYRSIERARQKKYLRRNTE